MLIHARIDAASCMPRHEECCTSSACTGVSSDSTTAQYTPASTCDHDANLNENTPTPPSASSPTPMPISKHSTHSSSYRSTTGRVITKHRCSVRSS